MLLTSWRRLFIMFCALLLLLESSPEYAYLCYPCAKTRLLGHVSNLWESPDSCLLFLTSSICQTTQSFNETSKSWAFSSFSSMMADTRQLFWLQPFWSPLHSYCLRLLCRCSCLSRQWLTHCAMKVSFIMLLPAVRSALFIWQKKKNT